MLRQAVFLVGGLGSRLGDLTRATPKPLLPVAGRPFIDYLIDEAARHHVEEVILLAGQLGTQFEDRYQGTRCRDTLVRVLIEPQPMGTGGAIRLALPELDSQFLLCNGDSFFDINLRALPSPNAGDMTMALRATAAGARYGTVSVEDGRVRSFHRPDDGIPGPINAGIYLVSREVVGELPDGSSSLENDLFPRLATEGRILGATFSGFFIDMGMPVDLARAHDEMVQHSRRPAVFFDRDGVLNVERNYVHRPDQFEWLPGAREAIRLCNDRGYLTFVVSNQAGVAHGYYDEDAVRGLHRWMAGELAAVGAHIEDFEFCPHHPDGKLDAYRKACDRRKPAPGMIRDLLGRWNVDPARSFLVGDRVTDVEAARAAGIAGHVYDGADLRAFVADRMT